MNEPATNPSSLGTRLPGSAVIIAGLLLIALPYLAITSNLTFVINAKLLWFFFASGCGVLALGYFGARHLWAIGVLFCSFFVGGAAQLWLTQPLWFPAITLTPVHGLVAPMALLILAQAVIAIYYLSRLATAEGVKSFIRAFNPIKIILFLLISAAFSVSIMGYIQPPNMRSYIFQIVMGGGLIGINLLTLAAITCQPLKARRGINVDVRLLAVAAIVMSAVLGWYGFDNMPHVEDEVAYLFQAKTFAGGALTVPAPPPAVQAGLDYYLFDIVDGRWFSVTAPGWPAILTLGIWLSMPWLVNPLLAGLSVLLAHRLTKILTTAQKANIVALLMATSPWFLSASASLMPHTTAIFFTLAGWNLLVSTGKSDRSNLILALVGGLCIGWVFVTRQLDGVLVGVATGIWLLTKLRDTQGMARVISYSIGCILTGSIYLIYNWIMTGNPLLAPLAQYINELWGVGSNAYGFGPDIGPPGNWGALAMLPGHSAYEGVINTVQNLAITQLDLFGWGIGSLALVWALLIWGKLDRTDWMMLILALAVIVAMFFYWFSGSFYIGPRYWFALFIPVLILSVSGYEALKQRLSTANFDQSAAALPLIALCLFGILIFTTWRGSEKYRHYGSFYSVVRSEMNAGAFGNAIVFVKTDVDIGSAFVLNDPYLRADRPIFVLDRGAEANAEVAANYPDRPTMTYDDSDD